MSQTVPASPKPDPAEHREHHHGRFVGFIFRIPHRAHMMFMAISWVHPVFVMGVGCLFAALRQPIGEPTTSQLAWGLLTQLILSVAFLIWEWFYVSNRNTSIEQLQTDTIVTIIEALVLMAGFGFFLHGLWWVYLVPWVGSTIDAILTPVLSINNVAQKPGVSAKVGT